ncbi:MAG: conjugal transfer protein TraM [Burkholderiales bacterium]|uniref:conjugal transfer protein TraM n=1 Tax=Nitrosomonas sp. TaxID=42353 RepID=UPI00283D3517|nr:conjugal transfer protein TraM [Nitrosomonas sp.]MCP5252544.1 conjugal transfer protein TraM [Burkholderiales bacterium]MDR4513593.1 conjugal transfer protein TraM [Nitrosomonas sp.]
MNNDKLDALIKRIASEHGIVLTKDDPVLMMHTLNEVLLEQNEKAQAELLNKYEAILQENFSQWQTFASKKANVLINAQQSHFSKNNDQLTDNGMQQVSEIIRITINHEIRELTRISRQAAIMNLLAAILVLVSVVIVVFMLL